MVYTNRSWARWGSRGGAALAAALVLVGGAAVAAHAAPSTKYYTATLAPSAVPASASQQAFTLTLTNCGTGTPGCPNPSKQSFGSADVQLDPAFGNLSATVSTPGWSAHVSRVPGLIELRPSGKKAGAIAPGQSLVVSVLADTPSTIGTYTWTTEVKQANDFHGAGNNFLLAGSQPQVFVGVPDHLAFVTQPSNVQVTTSSSTSAICPPPSVQVVAADGSPVTAGSAQVQLAADPAFGDPSLGGTTTATTVAGLATFGTPDCSSGVDAHNLGTGYRLAATAVWTYGSLQVVLATAQDSTSFDVIQLVTTCPANSACGGTTSGDNTIVDVDAGPAPTPDQLQIAVGLDPFALTQCRPFAAPVGMEITRVLLDHRDKTVTLTYGSALVNQTSNDGISLFRTCFSAPWSDWVTDSRSAPTYNPATGEYEGLLPRCGGTGLAAFNPCVVSAQENESTDESGESNETVTVVVSIPYENGRSDPKLW